MLTMLLVVLAADPEAPPAAIATPPAVTDNKAKDTAALGIVTAVVAGGLAAALPFTEAQPGTSPTPLILGTTAFLLVAFVRPAVFFSNQPARPPPTALNNTLRVVGTATALLGLVALITSFAMRPNDPAPSTWAMAGAAGFEALSAASFSIDAFLGL